MNQTPRRARACGAACLLRALRISKPRRHLRRLGVPVTEQRAGERLSIADVSAVLEERWAMVPACTAHYPRPCGCEPYEASGMDEFYGPTSLWVDPSPARLLALFEEEQ